MRLFLDLEEERVFGAVAFHVDAIVAQTHGAGADDFEGDVERFVAGEEMLALGLKRGAVSVERGEDFLGCRLLLCEEQER